MRPLGAWTGVAAGALRGSSLFRHYVAMKSLHNVRSLQLFSFPKIYAFVIFFLFLLSDRRLRPALSLKAKPILRLQRFCKKIERCVNLIGEIRVCRPKLYVMRSMSFFFIRSSPHFCVRPLPVTPPPSFWRIYLAVVFSVFQVHILLYRFTIGALQNLWDFIVFGSRRLFHALYPVVRRFVETRNPRANDLPFPHIVPAALRRNVLLIGRRGLREVTAIRSPSAHIPQIQVVHNQPILLFSVQSNKTCAQMFTVDNVFVNCLLRSVFLYDLV